jgi:hypothetical protein
MKVWEIVVRGPHGIVTSTEVSLVATRRAPHSVGEQ